MTSATRATQHLIRAWRSVPLLKLKQGSTLSIQSTLPRPTHVRIQPEWRDDGHVELEHFFNDMEQLKDQFEVVMDIEHEDSIKTSLGRIEPFISLHLHSSGPSWLKTPSLSVDTKPESDAFVHESTPNLIEKVILDDGTILPDSKEFASLTEDTRRVEYSDGVAHITGKHISGEAGETFLAVKVPEKVNLICDLQSGGGSVTVTSKLEGDVKLATADGDISVTKLRGHEIDLSSRGTSNSIYVKDKLEAEKMSINISGRARIKQLFGNRVEVTLDHGKDERCALPLMIDIQDEEDDEGSLVDVSALFVSGSAGATINVGPCRPSRRAVRVKSHHGPLEVLTRGAAVPAERSPITEKKYPLVELGGVNGSCEVTITNSLMDDVDADWTSCLVHFDSLSSNSVSLITVDRGNASVTMDRKIESDIRLLSTSSTECLAEASALLAEEEDTNVAMNVLNKLPAGPIEVNGSRLTVETTAFMTRSQSIRTDDLEYIDGWVENESEEPDSRFELKRGGGKIRLDGAAEQALKGFAKEEGRPIPSQDQIDSDTGRPLVAVASTGKITLETVSWIGAIARRYGLEENRQDIGRTASRKGRGLSPREDS